MLGEVLDISATVPLLNADAKQISQEKLTCRSQGILAEVIITNTAASLKRAKMRDPPPRKLSILSPTAELKNFSVFYPYIVFLLIFAVRDERHD